MIVVGKTKMIPFNYVLDDNPNVIQVADKETVEMIVSTMLIENTRLKTIPKLYFNGYYQNISDFISHPNCVLLKGSQSIYQWINSKSIYTLESKINVPTDVINVDGTLYFSKRVPSIQVATQIATVWDTHGYLLEYTSGANQPNLQYTIYYSNESTGFSKPFQKGIVPNNHGIVVMADIRRFAVTKYHVLLSVEKNRASYMYRMYGTNYIAQPASSYFEALKIGWFWQKYKYNPFRIAVDDNDVMFSNVLLWKCNQKGELVNSIDLGDPNAKDKIVLVAYKVLDRYFYTALLKL
jgi:hypothetical protein